MCCRKLFLTTGSTAIQLRFSVCPRGMSYIIGHARKYCRMSGTPNRVFTTQCPRCRKVVSIPLTLLGKPVICPLCSYVFLLQGPGCRGARPSASQNIDNTTCPRCGTPYLPSTHVCVKCGFDAGCGEAQDSNRTDLVPIIKVAAGVVILGLLTLLVIGGPIWLRHATKRGKGPLGWIARQAQESQLDAGALLAGYYDLKCGMSEDEVNGLIGLPTGEGTKSLVDLLADVPGGLTNPRYLWVQFKEPPDFGGPLETASGDSEPNVKTVYYYRPGDLVINLQFVDGALQSVWGSRNSAITPRTMEEAAAEAKAAHLCGQAEVNEGSHKLDLAIQKYTEAINTYPTFDHGRAYYNRARIYHSRRQFELAASDYQQVISISPHAWYGPRARVYLALILSETGADDEALEHLNAAMPDIREILSSDGPEAECSQLYAQALCGRIYERNKRFALAKECFRRVQDIARKFLVFPQYKHDKMVHRLLDEANAAIRRIDKVTYQQRSGSQRDDHGVRKPGPGSPSSNP